MLGVCISFFELTSSVLDFISLIISLCIALTQLELNKGLTQIMLVYITKGFDEVTSKRFISFCKACFFDSTTFSKFKMKRIISSVVSFLPSLSSSQILFKNLVFGFSHT